MTNVQDIIDDLNKHFALCQELSLIVERECRLLRQAGKQQIFFELFQLRKSLLPRFNLSLENLRQHRARWLKFTPEERAQFPEVGMLLRQNQDLTMKIILLDRENEQALLRRGLLPARELPSVNRQRPHYVAELYRRQGAS